jgi:hypothetical protein
MPNTEDEDEGGPFGAAATETFDGMSSRGCSGSGEAELNVAGFLAADGAVSKGLPGQAQGQGQAHATPVLTTPSHRQQQQQQRRHSGVGFGAAVARRGSDPMASPGASPQSSILGPTPSGSVVGDLDDFELDDEEAYGYNYVSD